MSLAPNAQLAQNALASFAPEGTLRNHGAPNPIPTVTTGAPIGWW